MREIDPNRYSADLVASWFPDDRVLRDNSGRLLWNGKTFELGLALAGAVSGGAYAAGAMDFLFEALDAWELAKGRGEDVPQHEVSLRMIAGASAGSINGAIAATVGTLDFAPLHYFPYAPGSRQGDANPFYRTWVKNVGIEGLLGLGDVVQNSSPDALLDSTKLDVIGSNLYALARALPPKRRKWLGAHWPLVFTASNLNGIPFQLGFGIQQGLMRYGMRLHADRLCFAVPNSDDVGAQDYPPDHERLPNLSNRMLDPAWRLLIQAGLASGAFPVALAARSIERREDHYLWRFVSKNAQGLWCQAQPQVPKWPMDCLFVDGGAMDNEPFELVIKALAGSRGVLPALGSEACGAVVMIAPFNDPSPAAHIGDGILTRLPPLLSALISQARFKSDDILKADFGGNYNRFMITPQRNREHMKPGQPILASGALSAFFGFFSEAYRHHDFFLGRRNAQRFLHDFFVVPQDNPLAGLGCKSAAARALYCSASTERRNHTQIIPLVGALKTGVGDTQIRPPWPDAPEWQPDPAALEEQIDQRLEHLMRYSKRFLDTHLERNEVKRGWRWAIDQAWKCGEPRARRLAVTAAVAQVKSATQVLREGKPS